MRNWTILLACRQRKVKTNLTNLMKKLAVCQSTIQTRFIAFPVNSYLVTKSSFNISIQAIITDVGDPTLEPLKQCNKRKQTQSLNKHYQKEKQKQKQRQKQDPKWIMETDQLPQS